MSESLERKNAIRIRNLQPELLQDKLAEAGLLVRSHTYTKSVIERLVEASPLSGQEKKVVMTLGANPDYIVLIDDIADQITTGKEGKAKYDLIWLYMNRAKEKIVKLPPEAQIPVHTIFGFGYSINVARAYFSPAELPIAMAFVEAGDKYMAYHDLFTYVNTIEGFSFTPAGFRTILSRFERKHLPESRLKIDRALHLRLVRAADS